MADESLAPVFLDAQVGVGYRNRHGAGARVGGEIHFAIERVHRHFRADLETAGIEDACKRATRDGLATVLAQRLCELRVLYLRAIEMRGHDVTLIPLAGRE